LVVAARDRAAAELLSEQLSHERDIAVLRSEVDVLKAETMLT